MNQNVEVSKNFCSKVFELETRNSKRKQSFEYFSEWSRFGKLGMGKYF